MRSNPLVLVPRRRVAIFEGPAVSVVNEYVHSAVGSGVVVIAANATRVRWVRISSSWVRCWGVSGVASRTISGRSSRCRRRWCGRWRGSRCRGR